MYIVHVLKWDVTHLLLVCYLHYAMYEFVMYEFVYIRYVCMYVINVCTYACARMYVCNVCVCLGYVIYAR